METEERIAVVALSLEFEKIFGILVAVNGLGKEVTEAALKEVKRYYLNQLTIVLSFNTTAANSGMLTGACMQNEGYLGHSFL